MSRSDDELDALLARGRMGGPARDRALQGALPRPFKRVLMWALPLLVGATAIALILRTPDDPFRARGGGGTVVEVECPAGCKSGEVMMLRVAGATRGGFLSAFGEPEGGGDRVWYFPAQGAQAPSLAATGDAQLLSQGIRLQAPGRWRLSVVISEKPLERDQVVAAVERGGPDVTRLTVTVAP